MPTTTILVIDDDPTIRQVAREFLHAEGYTVFAVADARAGPAIVREHAVDLILLDHNTGPIQDDAFIRGVRDLSSSPLPIVLWTAWPKPAERALSIGADGGLEKPTNLDALLDRVHQEIGAP